MDKKPPSKTAAPRHRFVDTGETTVMPLAEILRNRDNVFEESTPAVKTGTGKVEPSEFSGDGAPKTVELSAPRASTGTASGLTPQPKQTLHTQTQHRLVPDAFKPVPVQNVTQAPPPGTSPKASSAPKPKPVPPPEGGSTRVLPKAQVPEPTQMVKPSQLPQPLRKEPEKTGAATSAEVKNQVIVFFSTKGGAGATALSLNVAHHHAREQRKTCLVDMDLQLGDALAALALQPRFTIAQASAMVATGGSVSASLLPKHASGVSVLSQVGSLDDLDKVSSEGMAQLVEDLRGQYDVVVVDGVRDFSDNVLAVLDVADKIAIVTVQEVLAIRRARWSFNILRKIGFDPKDVTIVVNRFNATSEIPFTTIKRIFDPALVMTVPAELALVTQSLNRGVPLQELNPQHTLTRNIGRLADNLVGNVVPEENEVTAIGKPSFWQRLTGK